MWRTDAPRLSSTLNRQRSVDLDALDVEHEFAYRGDAVLFHGEREVAVDRAVGVDGSFDAIRSVLRANRYHHASFFGARPFAAERPTANDHPAFSQFRVGVNSILPFGGPLLLQEEPLCLDALSFAVARDHFVDRYPARVRLGQDSEWTEGHDQQIHGRDVVSVQRETGLFHLRRRRAGPLQYSHAGLVADIRHQPAARRTGTSN